MIKDKTECNNPLFGRILTAMVTPFTENGDVDYEPVSYTHLTLPTKA